MWTGDNLPVLRGLNNASVALIYLDPPFNSNKTYSAPIGSKAAGAAFKDTWTLDDVDLAWHGEIAEQNPAVYSVIDAAGVAHGKGMKSYLIMMAVRLLEMHRVLKPTGSLYLHCDPTASHYLRCCSMPCSERSTLEVRSLGNGQAPIATPGKAVDNTGAFTTCCCSARRPTNGSGTHSTHPTARGTSTRSIGTSKTVRAAGSDSTT